jgi:pSer/pThr/pTyr-binding forkhead associated (FHA) protein
MFALEITFADQPDDIETILVRRHKALIGASELAHIEIQDMQTLNYDLRLIRDISAKFRVAPISKTSNAALSNILEGVYERTGVFDMGKVKLNITALDSDLMLKDSEPTDRAGVRVMRMANSSPSPVYPALVILGNDPFVMSFTPDSPVYVGSAKGCSLRLDAKDVSPRHARIGYESGEFWVEDLGSSQGTYINSNQISGRISLKSGSSISIGKSITIIGISTAEQLQQALNLEPGESKSPSIEERKYPVLISMSEVVRPARMIMPLDSVITIGRDPQCDMWFGAPHVSRKHCSFTLSKTGQVSISDFSKNGTLYDEGILKKGDLVRIKDKAHAFDFGGGITLALCFNETQEKQYIEAAGNPEVFVRESTHSGERVGQYSIAQPELLRNKSIGIRRPAHGNKISRFIYNLVVFYQSLSSRNRVALYITLAAVVVVLVVLLNLILRLNF